MNGLSLDLFAGVVPFVAVAETRSFRAAARDLKVTPSAVSKAIARLEETLGVRLLQRSTRSVRLTAEGEAVFRLHREAVSRALSARDLALDAQSRPTGVIRVSASPVLGRSVLAPALPRLFARYPELSVQLLLTDRFVDFAGENIDVALRIGESPDSNARARLIGRTRWVTAASPNYWARAGKPRRPADLAAHQCLRYVRQDGTTFEWSFRSGGVAVRGPMLADHGETLVGAALADAGVIQVTDFLIRRELAEGRLVEVLAEEAMEGPKVRVLTAPGRGRSPKIAAFTEFAGELFAPARAGE